MFGIFSPKIGEIIQFEEHIFQNQLVFFFLGGLFVLAIHGVLPWLCDE